MKVGKAFLTAYLLLFIVATVAANSPTYAATVNPPVISAVVEIQGNYTATAAFSYNYPLATSTIDQNYVLSSDQVSAENTKPSDVITSSSVTRLYSNSFAGGLSTGTSSIRSVWQTVMVTPETANTQLSTKKDLTAETFYTLEDLYTQLNRSLLAVGKTAADADITKITLEITLDKASVDYLFTQAKNSDSFTSIAEQDPTNQAKIAVALDPIWDNYLLDMVYAKINLTDYAAGWDIGEEIANVTTSVTDNDVDGLVKYGSMRNALFGYIGAIIADDNVINPSPKLMPNNPPVSEDSYFVGFVDAGTYYVVDFNLFGDFVSSNKLIQGMGLALSQIFPSVLINNQQAFPFWVHLLVSAIIATVVALLYVAVKGVKSKKLKKQLFVKVWLIAFAITMLIMVISFPMILSFTV